MKASDEIISEPNPEPELGLEHFIARFEVMPPEVGGEVNIEFGDGLGEIVLPDAGDEAVLLEDVGEVVLLLEVGGEVTHPEAVLPDAIRNDVHGEEEGGVSALPKASHAEDGGEVTVSGAFFLENSKVGSRMLDAI